MRRLWATASETDGTLSIRDVAESLKRLPETLFDIYDAELKRIISQGARDVARVTFCWLLYACRPLGGPELLDVLRFNLGTQVDLKGVEKALQPFVVPDPTSSSIQLTHMSLYDFLKNNGAKQLFLEDEPALQCLSYLVQNYTKSPSKLGLRDEAPQAQPFLQFACSFWGVYVRQAILNTDSPNLKTDTMKTDTVKLLRNDVLVQDSADAIFASRQQETQRFQTSALHLAAFFGLYWAIPHLLESRDRFIPEDSLKKTPLHLASQEGFPECVELLWSCFDTSDPDSSGRTPLHYAAIRGHLSVSKLLTSKNTEPISMRDKEGKTPLVYAAEFGHVLIARLFEKLVELSASDLELATRKAIESRQMRTAEFLLEISTTPANMSTC